MSYVLKRRGDGWYVGRPGAAGSYTKKLQAAKKFPTREAAQAEACGNEYPVSIEDEVSG